MRVYVDRAEIQKFPNFRWSMDNHYLCFIDGIQIERDRYKPVYRPIFSTWESPAILYLEIHPIKRVIILAPWWPFIRTSKTQESILEDEDDRH